MTNNPTTPCRSTQHCAYHGWCRRCDPAFAAVMSLVNVAIQRTDAEESHWGPLYAAVAEALRPASSVVPVPPADRAAVLREAADRYAKLTDQNEAYDREHGQFDAEARLQHGTVRDVVAGLRRMAAEAQQQPDTEAQPDIQVWPLQRILAEVRCGSQDWSWDEEWADLDRRHAETGYLAKLERKIAKNGITMPVLIGSDGRLWDGHHRLRVALRLHIPYVPVEIVPPAEPGLAGVADQPAAGAGQDGTQQ